MTRAAQAWALGIIMFSHTCHIDDMKVVAARPNPLDDTWSEWTLVACQKCGKVYEWQHHSAEQMHGGDLEISALPTADYLEHKYNLREADIQLILKGAKKVRRYDRYKKQYFEHDA